MNIDAENFNKILANKIDVIFKKVLLYIKWSFTLEYKVGLIFKSSVINNKEEKSYDHLRRNMKNI